MSSNIAASVRARLSNQAKEKKRPFQELLQYYGIERFLYRFSQSQHSSRFLFKGALMLRVWGAPGSRPTRDIDFLGYVDNEIETLEAVVRQVCAMDVEDDGMRCRLPWNLWTPKKAHQCAGRRPWRNGNEGSSPTSSSERRSVW